MKTLFPVNQLVEVEWTDACGSGAWQDIDDYRKLAPMPCLTAGYLLVKDKEKVTVLSTQSLDGGGNGAISIPTQWIKSIRKLK